MDTHGQRPLPGPTTPARFLPIAGRRSKGICIEVRFEIPASGRGPLAIPYTDPGTIMCVRASLRTRGQNMVTTDSEPRTFFVSLDEEQVSRIVCEDS